MKLFHIICLFAFSFLFPIHIFAQHTNFPPACDVLEGTVIDSATKKPANKVWITVSWGDSSAIIACDSHGKLDEGALFYHTIPDSLKITCATTAYRVTKYKIKTYESTPVLDANGKSTKEKWYLIIITVWVTKVED